MAEAQAKTAPALPVAHARIAGRIEATRRRTGPNSANFFTLLALPAPDSYSHPGTVEITSLERLGAQGDEISVVVSISGYGRSVTPRDPQDSPYRTADNRLSFVAFA